MGTDLWFNESKLDKPANAWDFPLTRIRINSIGINRRKRLIKNRNLLLLRPKDHQHYSTQQGIMFTLITVCLQTWFDLTHFICKTSVLTLHCPLGVVHFPRPLKPTLRKAPVSSLRSWPPTHYPDQQGLHVCLLLGGRSGGGCMAPLWENPWSNSPETSSNQPSSLQSTLFPTIAGFIWNLFLQSEAFPHWTVNYFARLAFARYFIWKVSLSV